MSHQRQESSGSVYDPNNAAVAAAAAAQYQHQQHHAALQYQQQHMPYHMVAASQPPSAGMHAQAPPPPLQHHRDQAYAHHNQQPMQQAHLHLLQSFWMNQMHEIENVPQDFKLHHLPLARIKKVMKTDEDVKMISAEAPILFDKGCEIFITELTIRAWIHAEENKRRTLQRGDIAAAITKTDMFDFLIDIVPREDFKLSMAKGHKPSMSSSSISSSGHSEPRRSQEVFPGLATAASASAAAAAAAAAGMDPNSLEGYPYPYGMLEGGPFTMENKETTLEMWLSDTQKIGVGLTAFGLFFMLMGVILFFDGGLLAIGNILFLAGLTLVIGAQKTVYFFARRQKIRGTMCFFGGILLVFIKWPILGVIVELFGFINLFGDFFPVIISFLRRLPIIGNILSAPGVSKVVDRLSGQRLPV
ncbi:Golgi Transport [Lunasporangiospora selenospora]|uniref:Golgi Transport n=1 Tax=Lunasporangiospora selenospora TaxID=979761 RepID=A0A9P6KBT0_9FUNG|nr:Golgi Transport [Lunasporangiospora selenospora]